MKRLHIVWATMVLITVGCTTPPTEPAKKAVQAQPEWQNLFNGQNLDGWIIKIKDSEIGVNRDDIFRVKDGSLIVTYEDFNGTFKDQFGHIFFDRPFTNYHFRCEYRFVGEQIAGGPKWAYANSGAMLSGQDPRTMDVDQKFPVSLEFQFLAQDKTGKRATGSICTPGTYVDVDGATVKQHVIKSSGIALPIGEWVTAEAIVKDGQIRHIINGETVIECNNLKYDDSTPVTHGWISLQAESHPVQFRNIQIMVLD